MIHRVPTGQRQLYNMYEKILASIDSVASSLGLLRSSQVVRNGVVNPWGYVGGGHGVYDVEEGREFEEARLREKQEIERETAERVSEETLVEEVKGKC